MNDAVFNKTHYDPTLAGTVQDGGKTQLKIEYDATTRSYTLTGGGLSETFGPADHVGSDVEPYRNYRRQTSTSVSFFDIGTPSLGSPRKYHYVNGGYWQRNVTTADGGFDINFYPFVYGLPTAASGLPRSGTAGYAIDLFGFYTNKGSTSGSRVITGDGIVNVDFALGQLQLAGSAVSFDYINGTLDDHRQQFTGLAKIASNASFAGTFNYIVNNNFAGRFYGPGAEELGAVFWSDDPSNHFEGTIVGQRADSATPINFLLTDLIADQDFPMIRDFDYSHGSLRYNTNGSYTYINDITQPEGAPVFTKADRIDRPSSPDYAVYRASLNGSDYQLRLATPGNSNSLIQLHYASWGEFSVLAGPELSTTAGPFAPMADNHYFTYGLVPTVGVISPSGTAHYAGIILGRAVNNVDSWSVTGTSDFTMQFRTGAFSALLKMAGVSTTDGSTLKMPDLAIENGFVSIQTGELRGPTTLAVPSLGYGGSGAFTGQLYGPSGEELGGLARFELYNMGGTEGSTEVSVLALAKRAP